MDILINTLRIAHIAAGFISLLLFWLPVITKKGGKAHRLSGKWYVWMMWVVAGTAAALSVKNVVIGEYVMAAFLGFISIITANALWYGINILSSKKTLTRTHRLGRLVFSSVIVLSACALIVYGIALKGQGAMP